MKDVTSTSFGIVIAFVLPGLAAFYSLSFWSSIVNNILKTFLTVNSNVGLFLLVFAAAVIIGLHVTLIRWLLFEVWLCRAHKLDPSFFRNLGMAEERLSAFRAVVDEHYRYHQFWGGMAVVIPIFVAGVLRQMWSGLSGWQISLTLIVAVAGEALTCWAAVIAYELYSTRAKEILTGEE